MQGAAKDRANFLQWEGEVPSRSSMKITTWNARGLNAPSKKRLLKHNLKSFNFDIVLIQESQLNALEITKISRFLGVWCSVFHESSGASRGLGIL